jgi:hypothetical protein
MEHLGDVYFALKRNNEAVDQWNKVLALEPARSEIADKIKAAGSSPSQITQAPVKAPTP